MTIDPITLARFLVQPKVAELLDAFSRIPPGPMRDSVIHLATTLADQYSNAPERYAAPDPLLAAAQAAPAASPPAVEGPKKGPIAASPEAEVIKRRKHGQHPQQIADETGMLRSHVVNIITQARKAGMTFPSLHQYTGRPMERKKWVTSADQLSGQGQRTVRSAAEKRGLTVDEYLRRKQQAVDMALAGASYPEMAAATGMTEKEVSLWLSNARAAGKPVPYAPRSAAAAALEAKVVPIGRFFGPWATVANVSKAKIKQAAEGRGLTPDAYLDLQESIVRRRLAGAAPAKIAEETGEQPRFIYDTMQTAQARGAQFPPITELGLRSNKASA